ncbi:cotranscriptional regulator FAM172A, partial [Caerostris darwini]
GQLHHITTGAAYEFNVKEEDHAFNQRRYEALGNLVTDYVYDLLEKECGLKKRTVPLDAHSGEPTTSIFHSEDAFTNDKIVILIHGTGVVRSWTMG